MSGTLTIPANEAAPPYPASLRGRRVNIASLAPAERRAERAADAVVYCEGERIYFRPLDLEDEPQLRKWINDPVNRQYLLHRGPLNSLREREFIESQGKSASDYVFGVVARQGERLIGTVGLHRIDAVNRSATLGLQIGDNASKGRGYGREAVRLALKYAFEELNLNRVELSVFADNWRAIRTYQKVGFVQEGCARQAQYRNGRYQDEYRFAMLRSEWETAYGSET
jgi:RimJ/RimL family protein N-acetyltransferase